MGHKPSPVWFEWNSAQMYSNACSLTFRRDEVGILPRVTSGGQQMSVIFTPQIGQVGSFESLSHPDSKNIFMLTSILNRLTSRGQPGERDTPLEKLEGSKLVNYVDPRRSPGTKIGPNFLGMWKSKLLAIFGPKIIMIKLSTVSLWPISQVLCSFKSKFQFNCSTVVEGDLATDIRHGQDLGGRSQVPSTMWCINKKLNKWKGKDCIDCIRNP